MEVALWSSRWFCSWSHKSQITSITGHTKHMPPISTMAIFISEAGTKALNRASLVSMRHFSHGWLQQYSMAATYTITSHSCVARLSLRTWFSFPPHMWYSLWSVPSSPHDQQGKKKMLHRYPYISDLVHLIASFPSGSLPSNIWLDNMFVLCSYYRVLLQEMEA